MESLTKNLLSSKIYQGEISGTKAMVNELMIFVIGCVGAAAPEIVRLYKIRLRKLSFRKYYFVISALFFLFGGLVAVFLPASTAWGAFYVGASWPVIFSSLFGKTSSYYRGGSFVLPAESAISLREYLGSIFL